MTINHQPADMGIIESLKVGYKKNLLRNLLSVFDMEGGYHNSSRQRAQAPRGCIGFIYGGKETVLDAMIILNDLWSADNKYSKENGILRCWRKDGILPASWNADINNAVGSASLAAKEKTVSKD